MNASSMKNVRLLSRCLITLLLTATANADTPVERQSLKGIQGVYVYHEKLHSSLVAMGLTDDMVQTDVEVKLRLAGIKVLTDSDLLKTPGGPSLYVNLNVLTSRSGQCAFSSRVELQQGASLVRNGEVLPAAVTWSTGGVGMVGRSSAVEFIRNDVKDHVDEFVNAYLSVNPK